MLGFAILYIFWTEPFHWQQEASAEKLIAHLGQKYVTPKDQHFMNAATCKFDRPANFSGTMGLMTPESLLLCTIPTPCGPPVEQYVWHNRYIGVFTSAEPPSWTIAESCIDMLNPETRASVEASMGQGG